jgi:hypothetical protein
MVQFRYFPLAILLTACPTPPDDIPGASPSGQGQQGQGAPLQPGGDPSGGRPGGAPTGSLVGGPGGEGAGGGPGGEGGPGGGPGGEGGPGGGPGGEGGPGGGPGGEGAGGGPGGEGAGGGPGGEGAGGGPGGEGAGGGPGGEGGPGGGPPGGEGGQVGEGGPGGEGAGGGPTGGNAEGGGPPPGGAGPDGGAPAGPVEGSILIQVDREQSGEPQYTQLALETESSVKISGDASCDGCSGELVLRVTKFLGANAQPSENDLITTKKLAGVGNFTILVPKGDDPVNLELLVDKDSNGKPTKGERFAVYELKEKLPSENQSGISIDATDRELDNVAPEK